MGRGKRKGGRKGRKYNMEIIFSYNMEIIFSFVYEKKILIKNICSYP